MGVVAGRSIPNEDGSTANTAMDDREWTFANQGLGDIQIHPKLRFLNATRRGLGFAVMPSVILGTGDKNSFLGEGQTMFQPTAIVDTELGYLGRFRAAINAGMRIRGSTATYVNNMGSFSTPPTFRGADITTGGSIEVKNEVIGGVGLSYGIVPQKFDVVAELYGNYGLDSWRTERTGAAREKMKPSAEAIGAIKLYLARNSFFEIGAGWKVSGGYGSATPRAFVGFIFEPSIGDRDGDGYKDDVDQCPDDPEDFDDFEDEDGCPEPDNDKDGILDDPDKCPNEPETKNGYQDEDGCPDATTFDRDGDRIPDDVDKCPDDPEDFDNFEDEDGCPDPDNDKDGIKDIEDACPNVPEDKDGFEDTDGCPDPDNDHDRILDVSDKCPNEPETYNNVNDDDGCPDQGLATMTQGQDRHHEADLLRDRQGHHQARVVPGRRFGGRGDQRQPVDRAGRDPGARRRARRRRPQPRPHRAARRLRPPRARRAQRAPEQAQEPRLRRDQADLQGSRRELLEQEPPGRVHHREDRQPERRQVPGRRRAVGEGQ